MRPTASFAISCFALLAPALARAQANAEPDGNGPRVDMLGNPIEEPTTTSNEDEPRASTQYAPDRQEPAGWPVPEIMRAHERATTGDGSARSVPATPAAASPGYAVPRTVTVTYSGDVPVASDGAPRIAMEVAPATNERPRVLAVSVDPLGFVNGHYGASIARRLGDHAALRLDGQFGRAIENVNESSTWRLGLSIPLFLNKTFQGPFIEPGLAASRRLLSIGAYSDPPYALFGIRDYVAGPEIFVGWQWMFDNGFHVAAALGATQDWTGDETTPGVIGVVYGSPPLGALGGIANTKAETYLRVGYAF